MHLRNWLLTGTSIAVIALAPVTAARAQDAALQQAFDAYQAAQGTDNAKDAEDAFRAACQAAGYSNMRKCIAALQGGGGGDQPAAPADNQAPPADQPPAAEPPAPPAAVAVPPADQPPAEQPKKQRQKKTPAPADQQQPADQQPADQQPAADQPPASPPPADNQAAPADQQQAPAQDDQAAKAKAALTANINKALAQYQDALNEAASGKNYDAAKKKADQARARIEKLCSDAGYADVASCIGQDLPGLPPPPAAPAPVTPPAAPADTNTPPPAPVDNNAAPAQPAAPAEQPAAPADNNPPAANNPPPAAPADNNPAPADNQQPPAQPPAAPAQPPAPADNGQAPAVNPADAAAAQNKADLGTAAELYNVGVGQLDKGDARGQATIDAANKRFAEICAALGVTDVATCLQQNGITLPPLPTAPAKPQPPTQPPVADLPGANKDVTPEATEVLPKSVAPQDAAPILDSAKDQKADFGKGGKGGKGPGGQQPPANQQPPADQPPAGPPPDSDKAAQADVKGPAPQSVKTETGTKVDAAQLPPVQVPQNVTVINNVTNVTTIINNNGGGNGQNGNGPGGKGPGQGNGPGGNGNGPGNGGPGNGPGNGGNGPGNGNGGPGNGGPGNGGPGGPGGRPNYTNSGFIFSIGVNLVISNPAQDFDRINDDSRDRVSYEQLSAGRTKETVERPDGTEIVTIRDRWGNVLQRSRINPDGREYILASGDNRDNNRGDDEDFTNWRDPGDDLPPLRLNIPISDYILDADSADQNDVEDFLSQPPVERVRQIYSIEDVKRSARLRDSVRRLEIGGLTFDSGAATIARSQVGALSTVANAMLDLLEKNPAETFLIEGHTDAVGPDQSNLILSDQRASTVARILTDFYDIPPENLVTQGYGERFLKVDTQGPEQLNRRVTIKRITPLITVANN